MAFAFNTEKIQPKVMDRLELLNAQEELNNAWMNLTDAQKSMEEVCEVMENIRTSVDLITKYGAAGVEQLNIDGSLEALCGVEAKLITAEKAMETLDAQNKSMWEKFKDAVAALFKGLKEWFEKLIADDDAMLKKIADAKSFTADTTEYKSMMTTDALISFKTLWNDLNLTFTALESTQMTDTEANISAFENIIEKIKKLASETDVIKFNDVSGAIGLETHWILKDGTLESLGFKTVEDAKKFAEEYKMVIVARRDTVVKTGDKLAAKVVSMLSSVLKLQGDASGNEPQRHANYVKCLKIYATLATQLDKALKSLYAQCRRTMVVLAKHCSAEISV